MPRRAFTLPCRWLPAVVLLAGCAPDADVIARVGHQEVRRGDLEVVARTLQQRYPMPADSLKQRLLDALIQRELLVEAAQQEGFHRDTVFLDFKRRTEEQMLRQRMVGELSGGPIAVSEAEIAELHRWRDRETRGRVIFTRMRSAADAALAEIRHGAGFAEVADRFNPTGFAPPGGDLGFLAPGFLQQPLDDVLRTAPIGRVVGPIEAPSQGWFIVRVEDRRARENPPLAREHALLASILRQRKQRHALVRTVQRLKAEYGVRVRPGAAQELMLRFQPTEQGETAPPLSEGERAIVLAEYRDGFYTLGDALADLEGGDSQRPNFQVQATVENWLESRAFDRSMLLESRARLYQDEPAMQRGLRMQLDDYLLQGYFGREVLERTGTAGDADAKALYMSEPGHDFRLQEASLLMVALKDSATAVQLAQNARHAGGLRDAVAAAGLPGRVREETVRFPTQNPVWSALEPALMSLGPGEYAEPLAIPGAWLVVQLVSKKQGPIPYETLPDEMKRSLQHEVDERLRSIRLDALTDSLRRAIPVTVYGERLKRLRLPEPAPQGGQG